MSFPPWALITYASLSLFFAAAWIFSKGRIKSAASNAVLVVLTFFVAHVLITSFAEKKIGRTNPAVAAESNEMQMRIVSCFDSMRRRGIGPLPSKETRPAKRGDAEEKQRSEAFAGSEKALSDAVAANPKNQQLIAKLIILLGSNRTPEHIQRIKQLDHQLAETQATPDDQPHQLAKVLSHVYIQQEVSKQEVDQFRTTLTTEVPDGWYQEQAVERLLELQPDKKLLEEFRDANDARNVVTLIKFFALGVVFVVAALIGVINAIIQLGMTARRKPQREDEVGLPLPLKSVYAVFITWFSFQLFTSTMGHLVLTHYAEAMKQPNVVALTTMITYLISFIPAPILIYFIALKPRGVQPKDFFRELKITPQTSTAGLPKIILMGWLGWCTAIPIVMAAAFVAFQLLHTRSSDNPVLSQISKVANGTDPIAVIVFYFTLGVLAPLFEEILFRGFLFAALKPRIGTFFAMVASAATFAAMHFDKGGSLMLFAIGFVLAFTFNRTRTLLSSMITHGLWNAGTFTLVLVLFGT